MSKIIIVIVNKGKVKEFEKIFVKFNIEVVIFVDFLEIGEIEEIGIIFVENVVFKVEMVVSVLN